MAIDQQGHAEGGNGFAQQLLQGSALIGRTVEFNAGDGTTYSGTANGIVVLSGQVYVDVDGAQVPLSSIVAVTE